MIKAKDTLYFHRPAAPNRTGLWAETTHFDLYVPQQALSIKVYTIFRPFINNALSNIFIWRGFDDHPRQALYNDYQVHLQLPEGQELGDIRLPNGLHIRSESAPMNYRVSYDGLDSDTGFEFAFEGLMPPQDITDPDMDPITARSLAAAEAKQGVDADTAYKGHYEQTGHFTGELRLRGRRMAIDCVSTIDHSWGPRPEAHCPQFAWGHAHFGRDLAMHWIFAIDPYGSEDYGQLAHGYVLEDGEVHGLVEGSGSIRREGLAQQSLELQLQDQRGKHHSLQAEPMNRATWNPWPMIWGHTSLHRWNCDGREGYGHNVEFGDADYHTRHNPY